MDLTDVDAALRTLALSRPTLVAIIGQRVFVGADLPAGYDVRPSPGNAAFTGPAVLFSGRGGRPGSTDVLIGDTYTARCYGVTQTDARLLDLVLRATLHNAQRGPIKTLRCNTTGQHTPDQNTGWHIYISTWELTAMFRP